MSFTRHLIYSPYERIWHWLQAAAILTLMLTGINIHNPQRFNLFGFALAVQIHNVLGFLLIANAFLGMFYYVTTGTIRQFLPQPMDFVSLSMRQARYYVLGIFRGESHPLEKTTERRLNPLQQITYLAILNVLLPLQLITGLLMWSGQQWPGAVNFVGGLSTLAWLHTAGAWLFATFVLAHIYLITTGSTPTAHLKAMILGYEETGR